MTTHEFFVKKDDVDAFRHAVNCCELKYKVTKPGGKTCFHVRVKGYQDVFSLGYYFRQEIENKIVLEAFKSALPES